MRHSTTSSLLLVESDARLAELTKITLSQAKFSAFAVTHAEGLAQALECLRTSTFDIVLLELGLSANNDVSAFAAIQRQNSSIPVVAVTRIADDVAGMSALEAGAQDYLAMSSMAPCTLEQTLRSAMVRHNRLRSAESRAAAETTAQSDSRTHVSISHERASLSDAVLGHAEAMIIVLTPDERFYYINQRGVEVCGFNLADLRDRIFASAFVSTKDADAIRGVFSRLRGSERRVATEIDLLTKHGDTHRIGWWFRRLDKVDGTMHSIVGTGIDVTDHHTERQQLQKLKEEMSRRNHEKEPSNSVYEDLFRNRRAYSRRSLGRRQRIALVDDAQAAQRYDFFEVLCVDISQGGMSFLLDDLPASRKLIVALEPSADVHYMKAELRNLQTVDYEGANMFQVGCKFLGRIDLDESQVNSLEGA